jgi:nitrate/nitrite transporter NarK
MKKNDTSEWKNIAGAILKMAGLWLLKIIGFVVWVCLSGVSILLKHIIDALKKKLFPKD